MWERYKGHTHRTFQNAEYLNVNSRWLIRLLLGFKHLMQDIVLTWGYNTSVVVYIVKYVGLLPFVFLGAFAHSRKASVSSVTSVFPSVLPRVSGRLTLDGFPWNLVPCTFMKISWDFVKIGEKYRAIYMMILVRLIVAGIVMWDGMSC